MLFCVLFSNLRVGVPCSNTCVTVEDILWPESFTCVSIQVNQCFVHRWVWNGFSGIHINTTSKQNKLCHIETNTLNTWGSYTMRSAAASPVQLSRILYTRLSRVSWFLGFYPVTYASLYSCLCIDVCVLVGVRVWVCRYVWGECELRCFTTANVDGSIKMGWPGAV